MFKKHAAFHIAGLRSLGSRQLTPHRTELAHANDNLRPAQARRSRPKLACHWVWIDGLLECRWEVENDGRTNTDAPDGCRNGGERLGPRYAPAHGLLRRISHNSL
jgi:hypothetical protein